MYSEGFNWVKLPQPRTGFHNIFIDSLLLFNFLLISCIIIFLERDALKLNNYQNCLHPFILYYFVIFLMYRRFIAQVYFQVYFQPGSGLLNVICEWSRSFDGTMHYRILCCQILLCLYRYVEHLEVTTYIVDVFKKRHYI